MDRSQKEHAVKELEEIFDGAGSVVMAAYSGMTVVEMEELRAKLREQGATFRVVKNRLAKIAMKGKPFEAAGEKFTGPVAIAWADDMISAPKVTVEFAKDSDSFEIIGGFMGEEIFGTDGIVALSKLPSREELIGMAAQRLIGQASEVARRLMSQGEGLAGAIKVIEEKASA
ncbi:LSU ribosomal protein L10P [Litorimonas taeanensis]|uniref:Large ribosomal subunit protein uL10 n=1 Tax=Litorimonas taeanensis TaxID=568099 RepID=A0A420WIE4_9PROT|nr:50S ribosomal protein L10 [Litorimonas taeanensis]RKQ70709.1 LSU ribosomal protein L10P [Litorimonas taeanensis]